MLLTSLMFSDFSFDNYPLPVIYSMGSKMADLFAALCVKTKAIVVAVLGTYCSEHGDRSL